MITPRMIYNFTFFQNMERARLRLVLRKVTDCNTNHSIARALLITCTFFIIINCGYLQSSCELILQMWFLLQIFIIILKMIKRQ